MDSADSSTLHVDVTGLRQTGNDRVVFEGTFDVFTTLIELRDLMTNPPAELEPDELSARLSGYIARVDTAHDDILDALRSLGFRADNMTLLENRVESLRTTSIESLSLAQDTEITEALVEFQQQEFTYRAALQVGARVVQVSLLNFI